MAPEASKRGPYYALEAAINSMKTLSKAIFSILTGSLLASGILCPQVQAVPIQGSIDFGGVVTYDTTSLATATRVNLWNSSFVLQSSGDFSSIAPNTAVTMAAPWIFNPSTATPSLWQVGGFKFDLSTSLIVQQTATFLNITGTGTISGNGFTATPGTWSFTSSDSSGRNQSTFGFQSQTAAVPEGNTVALLGFGGLCLVGVHLRKRPKPA